MGEASKAISSLITNSKGAPRRNNWVDSTALAALRRPLEVIADVGNATVGKDGKTL